MESAPRGEHKWSVGVVVEAVIVCVIDGWPSRSRFATWALTVVVKARAEMVSWVAEDMVEEAKGKEDCLELD